uniref:DM domain-containing protein n=1 Tax=Acrobeloides nanus TaxID=290746 RepID=A0A914EI61_9BILA
MAESTSKLPYTKRIPNCQKCAQHGLQARLKGHKQKCSYRYCECSKCKVISERQKLMADQIKMRRHQMKNTKEMKNSSPYPLILCQESYKPSRSSIKSDMPFVQNNPNENLLPQNNHLKPLISVGGSHLNQATILSLLIQNLNNNSTQNMELLTLVDQLSKLINPNSSNIQNYSNITSPISTSLSQYGSLSNLTSPSLENFIFNFNNRFC